ncbi:MAG: transcriptional regulator [Betaproteobacteria bacterium]|nr:transcriptional regulator [Betaproteobacteria bacterium]
MDEKKEFASRLATAMLDAGYEPRPSVLEVQFNIRYMGRPITYQAVTRWLKGEAIPAQDKLQVLADWLKVEPHILRFGGQPLLSIQERKKRWDAALSGPEREVLEAFINLPPEQKKIVRSVILTFAHVHAGKTPHDP